MERTRMCNPYGMRIAGLLVLLVMAAVARAQNDGVQSTHGRKTVLANKIETALTIDGNLDEPEWQRATVSLGFIQRDPQEGEPSTERTEFRVLYSPTTLYIAVLCYDSNPRGIRATDRQRDSSLQNDDTISIALDTFHDHRNSYLFRTNPLGTQFDALVTDEGRTVNDNWDERWEVAARVHEGGWNAEFAIPFKSVRTSEENGNLWGLDVERVIRRKNEFSSWNNYRRGFQLENASQAGHLAGIEEIETGLRVRVKPYLLGGFSHTTNRRRSPLCQEASAGDNLCNASNVGLEVMKWRITPSLTADFTANTDFAQTDVDDQQVNLDRFPLFFPEKREFFQEGAGTFVFQTNRSAVLFHSRRIGLSPRRLPVPIVAGARLTGRLGGFTLGLMNVQTEALPSENVPASNYGIYRVRREIFSRSSVGAMFMNREMGGTADYNRVYGVDTNMVFFRYFNLNALISRSDAPGAEGKWVSSGSAGWQSDFLTLDGGWVSVDDGFRDDMGFIPRDDMLLLMPRVAFRPRPNSRLIRQFLIQSHSDYTLNQRHEQESRLDHFDFEVRFQSGDVLAYAHHIRLERLKEPFEIRPGIRIPPGTYSWGYPGIDFQSSPARRVSVEVRWRKHGQFFDGSLDILGVTPSVRFTESFSVDVAYDLNRAKFPAGKYTDE
ncbi:MAG TPA: DUF5916 domain-containing protein, partial [Terriglobia bacterium]|nr:DUF5916 domain-containing protein [Terriglobia bacterium]